MVWTPRWGHVSQLFRHAGDPPGLIEGDNDCFEATLARYLRERAYPFAGSDAQLVASLRLRVTGQPDQAGQGFTTLGQAAAGLESLGISARWTLRLDDALAADWAIFWVRAVRLRLARAIEAGGYVRWTAYPLGWLSDSGAPDHFILRLPDGSFNDPLALWGGDARYSATSLAAAFGGAWVLHSPPAPGPSAPASAALSLRVVAPGGLHVREAPALSAPVLLTLPDGAVVADVYEPDCLWRFVRAGTSHGWVRREFVKGA